jgi:tetratricopeptide (TPR) repeat protein
VEKGGRSSQVLLSPSLKPPAHHPPALREWQILSRFSDAALMAVLAAASALPYLNTLRNGLVSDDEMQVLNNPYIRNFHYLRKIFTTQATSYIPGNPNFYRPLMNIGYLLCHEVFGLRPFGYHLANLLLHAAVVGAVFLLTKRMFENRSLALVAAALFAIHPIHSEAVAWVGASPDLELGFFYLLTFWLFADVARPGGSFSYAAQLAMTASFVLTIFSKEPAVTLPVLATIYEHFYRPDRRGTRPLQKFQRYAVLWALTGAYLLFRVRVLGALSSGSNVHPLNWYETLLSALVLLGQYLWKLIWPVGLRIFCPFHAPLSTFDPRVLGGLTAFAVCILLFRYFWRHAKPLSFGLLWLLAPLAPVLNVRWMPVAAFEERYLYLPSVGFCWLAGWVFLRLRERASARGAAWSRTFTAATAILAALCLLRIVTRNRDWRDNLTLYTNTLAACPDAYYVRRDLGLVHWKDGDDDSAEREWREALKTGPRHAPTWSSLGLMYLRKQNYSQAVDFFKKALEADPANPDARLYLGVTYLNTQALELAEPELRTAVAIYPFNSNARNALGKLYLEEGRMAEAEEQFRQSVEIEPNITAYGNLGLIHWRREEAALAEQQWRQALRLAPNDSSILNNLGLACTKLQRYPEAVSFFCKAIELNPHDPSPHSNLGIAYAKSGQQGLAETEFRAALSLAPQKYETRNRLGMLYLEGGRVEEAEEQFRLSLKTKENDAGYCGLGEIYLRRGERGAAEGAFQSAARLEPSNSQARFRLGALYLAQGHKAEALREYQAGLKSDPENSEAIAAAQKLSAQAGRK